MPRPRKNAYFFTAPQKPGEKNSGRIRFRDAAKTSPNLVKTSAKLVVTDRDLADRDALELAVTLALRTERKREFEALERRIGWEEAARICAYDCQSRSLRLPNWSTEVPCVAPVRGRSRASRLLRRMLRRGVSRWHPDPLRAIAAADAPGRLR
jgi:hypothetical protein